MFTQFAPFSDKIRNFKEKMLKYLHDRETPWVNNKAKIIIQEKNKIYQFYQKNNSNMLAAKLETLQT